MNKHVVKDMITAAISICVAVAVARYAAESPYITVRVIGYFTMLVGLLFAGMCGGNAINSYED